MNLHSRSQSPICCRYITPQCYMSFLITTYARIATPTITIPNIVHDIDDNTIFGSRKIVRRVVWKEIFIYAQCIITISDTLLQLRAYVLSSTCLTAVQARPGFWGSSIGNRHKADIRYYGYQSVRTYAQSYSYSLTADAALSCLFLQP